jgi:hypothetical protein
MGSFSGPVKKPGPVFILYSYQKNLFKKNLAQKFHFFVINSIVNFYYRLLLYISIGAVKLLRSKLTIC